MEIGEKPEGRFTREAFRRIRPEGAADPFADSQKSQQEMMARAAEYDADERARIIAKYKGKKTE